MIISVVCPVLNEENHIQKLIDFFNKAKPSEKELILVDGGSTDRTIEIIGKAIKQHANIILIHNPERIVPYALNLGIKKSSAEIIVRLDAHTEYDPEYFLKIIDTFDSVDAQIVGGPTRTTFTGEVQEAVAFAICTVFAIGDSNVHNLNYRGYTDSVTFGAWKREIFAKAGLFDQELIRNQDDEFHYRAKSLGFKIYQNPDIKLFYYPRSTLKSLFRQYFEYGLFKPLVLKKIRSGIRLRHMVPSFFFLYLMTFAVSFLSIYWLAPLSVYMILNIYFSFVNNKRLRTKILLLLVYPTIHLGYGLGFLRGLIKNIK